VLGNLGYLNWGPAEEIAANTYDVILGLLYGLAGESLTAGDLWPRPRRPAPATAAVDNPEFTVENFNVAEFMSQLAGG
jgi:hypothetical protein